MIEYPQLLYSGPKQNCGPKVLLHMSKHCCLNMLSLILEIYTTVSLYPYFGDNVPYFAHVLYHQRITFQRHHTVLFLLCKMYFKGKQQAMSFIQATLQAHLKQASNPRELSQLFDFLQSILRAEHINASSGCLDYS